MCKKKSPKPNFIIWTPDYSNVNGGIIALHKLGKIMSDLGENVWVSSNNTFPGSKAQIASADFISALDKENTMVIYPEIVCGNPFAAKYVTRWLLNTPGFIAGDGNYEDNDLVYKYYQYFKAPNESKVRGELRTYDLKLDKFISRNQPRSGECYIVKKGSISNKTLDKHRPDSICLDGYVGDDYLVDVFNKCEYFVCYDSMCFHVQQAVLCGCIPIIIPDDGVSREEFFERAPVNKFGVAYGFDDIEHARKTQHLLRDYLVSLDRLSTEQVTSYISDCYAHMGLKKQ